MENTLHEIIVTPENIPAWIVIHDPGTPDVVPHWHESVELICSLDSKLNIKRGGESILIEEDDVAVINSCQIHAVVPVKEFRNNGISITFGENFFKEHCSDMHQPYFDFSEKEEIRKEIADYMKKMYQLYTTTDRSSFFNLEVNSLLFHITYRMLTHCMINKSSHIQKLSGKYQERYREIMSFIKEHYDKDLSLADVAEFSHLSKDHLSREFKHYVGEGFRDYLNNVRLSKAHYDLMYTDIPLVELAIKHGFHDLRSYNRAFAKHYEMSPMQYRTLIRTKNTRPIRNSNAALT